MEHDKRRLGIRKVNRTTPLTTKETEEGYATSPSLSLYNYVARPINMRAHPLVKRIRIYTNLTLIGGLLVGMLSSCIFEKYADCPPIEANVRIYLNPTLSGEVPQVRSLWQVAQIDVFIFDQQGVFFSKVQDTNIAWNPTYYLTTSLPTGVYTFVAWSNLKDNYRTRPQTFIKGTTTLAQAVMWLSPSTTNGLIDFTPAPLYFGQQVAISIEKQQENQLTIPLIQNTYQINYLVKGLETTNHHYDFTITDTNTAYYFDNSFVPSQAATYFTSCQMNAQAELLTGHTLLRIDRTRHPLLKITDRDTGEELFEADLVEIILKLEAQGIAVDFDKTHEFDVEIVLNRTAAGITAQVSINGWKLIDEDGTLE